ncbi:DUF748 domain-containing protein [Cupriavidus taiwanensis]|uniref:DUF748 domain-containing protein n=1 Tax=Cupriavidus taiwanensis TaxID=164546 RepID=UPI000E10319B|nr:DUF748 domain-containing protein [Cupriavidus taiwanensis]SOY67246.1 conserved hypothetical protein, DUF748 [Cupriavidus taiwanensis]SOY67506.1 conserved hypothetical protein, DUF748 [Cupriavidus taiwanensis]SOY94866.1 conserved hypothetical protein, DUF748 [Cupriavidus taiwanensis]SOZ71816.1 conserved hypothetical protein, DUF748 [Cupriavidus taiwanensis]SOZ87117.1 conserved hypothetical protein, DUF748 [Cupriavidus taiwanensis]
MAFKQSIQLAATAAATPRGRLAVRIAGGVAAALAVFGLAGYFGGPPLIKYLVEKNATEALGRKVTLGRAHVRPFELAATLTDLTIYERDGKTPALTLGEAQANTSLASVWHLAPVVDNLHVDRLAVHVVRGADGRMSFADVQEKFAALPPKPADAQPARFSVNNIAVTGSSLRYDDKLLDTTLRVDNLTLTLPFLSNLPHDVEIVTRPTLSAQVNGTPLALDGEVLPFADSRQTRLNINLDGLEVARMMAFAPPLRDAEVKSGKLDTRLTVAFRQQQDTQEMVVMGTAALREADIRTRAGQPLAKSARLALDITRLEPLAHRARLRSVEIEGLGLQAVRRADGTLNLATAFLPQAQSKSTDGVAPAPAPAASAPAAPPSASSAQAAPAGPTPKDQPWRYAIDRIVVRQAKLGFDDALAPSGPGKLALGPLDAEVKGFAGAEGDQPVRVEATLTVADGQTLHHTGDLLLRDGSMAGTLETTGLRPQGFAAWWPRELRSQFGTTAVNAELHYRMTWGTPQFQFVLEKSRLELAPLYLATRDPVAMPAAASRASDADARAADQAQGAGRRMRDRTGDRDGAALPLLQAQKLVLDEIQFDLAKQTFATSQVTLAQPQIAATRDHRGELLEMARLWASESAQQARGAPRRTAPAGANAAAAGGGWKANIGKIVVEDGSARLADYQPAEANRGRPVIHQFRNVGLSTGAVAWPLTAAAVPVRLHAESGRRGVIGIDGTVLPALPASRLQLDLRQVDVSPLQPYLADRFNAALRSGTLTVKGRLNVDAPAGKPLAAHFNGNVQTGNVRTVDRVSGDDFLRWRSLAVSGIDFAMDESKGPMRVSLGNIALSDFYARVILNANGRLNLQDVLAGGAEKGEAAPSTSLTQANPASAPAAPPVQAGDTRTAQVEQKPGGPKPQIRIGGVSVDKGNINFSDFFVKPNYTANLTGMKGSVSKVSSGDPTPADLVLDGRIDDDAPVNISGKLNPLGEQLFLDIAAKAAGVELTRLTPYAAKYAGYPITKGKLTVDVAYKIENGKLDARNHLFLDQLTFGERVDSPDATKLPVLLAVSLLKDRNGVIDVNLPVSGSLSDPEFSIGGVIVRVIVNLLTKAITSPFSLLASAFGGGGEELGYVEFAPGTATLTPAAKDKIAKLGQALNDRPSLRLEISGRIDPATDEAGARRAWLDARVAEQKRRDQRDNAQSGGQAGEDEAGEQGAELKVTKAEYPKYLEQVYKRTAMKKPRNFVGFAKTLPPEEMEKLLMANATVTEADLKRLAEQRALVVKQSLEREGKVPESRLFLTAPKLSADGIKDKGTPNRVDFSIRG